MRPLATTLLLTSLLASLVVPAPAAASPPPRLAVLVVFDQLRPWELDRLEPVFGPGGFGGLMDRSTARYDGRYTYAVTETGPGHATLATGANPPVHGICSNRWKNPDGETQYCVGDPEQRVFGAPEGATGGVSARWMRAPTLGDTLKLATRGQSKVVTISIKDRAAALTAGAGADLAVWYDADLGRFTTSTAWAKEPPAWLTRVGEELPAAAFSSGRWSPLPLPNHPGIELPPDDQPGESTLYGFGPTFPHDLVDVASPEDRKKAYRGTPQALADLVTLGLRAIDEESLGADGVPDLLVIGVSPTDFVGHWYGPQSLEMTEMVRHADRELRRLAAGLDRRLGKSGWVLAVAADHGGTPLPEAFAAARQRSGRIDVTALETRLAAAAEKALPGSGLQPRVHAPHLFVPGLAERKLPADKRAALFDELEAALRETEGIAHLYRVDSIASDPDPFAPSYRESIAAGRCDTLLIRQDIGFIYAYQTQAGTDHGTAYSYDATIPILVSGPGVRRGRYAEVADPRDVAATLAFLLGVPAPAASQGRPLSAVGAGQGVLPVFR